MWTLLETHAAERALPGERSFEHAKTLSLFGRADGFELFEDGFDERHGERARVRDDLRVVMQADAPFAVAMKLADLPFVQTIIILTDRNHAARPRVFDNNGNTSATVALVLIFSALVPFIGILFCPLAVFAGGLGLFEAWLVPRVGGARLAASCIGSGFVIAGAQVLLFRLV